MVSIRPHVEGIYKSHIEELKALPDMAAILSGEASREVYDRFIANVIKTHMRSPQFLGFIFCIAPPKSLEHVKHNLLEEIGVDGHESHPELLKSLAAEAGLTDQLDAINESSQETIRSVMTDPMMFGTLKEFGLGLMVEVFSFEYMLSRISTPIATALKEHRGLSPEAVEWFTHHSEVDIEHAEEAFVTLDDYVAHYDIDHDDAKTIADMVSRENLFIKRYFGTIELASSRGMVE